MLNAFSIGVSDPASSGIGDPSGVTTGSSNTIRKQKASRTSSLSDTDAILADDSDNLADESKEERRAARRAGRRGGGLSPTNSQRRLVVVDGGDEKEKGADKFQKKPVQRTRSGTQDRLTRSGSGAKIDEAMKRSGSGARLSPRPSRNIGSKSGSSRKLNANWSSSKNDKDGAEGSDHQEKKSLSRNGSSRKLGNKSGSARNIVGVKRTTSKKREGGLNRTGSSRSLSRPNSGLNLAGLTGGGDGDMKNHMDNMEAFLQVVSTASKDERDKIVMDALTHKTDRGMKL